mmetsp:Transcript_94107/g.263422  ORF Transcript_94107/g.263422 Transcript_94107/m.263422 type:complete len:408 (-) Transcript_94107:40-1263(-)
MAENLGGNGPRGMLVQVPGLERLVDLAADLLLVLRPLVVPAFVLADAVGVDVHVLHRAPRARLQPWQLRGPVDAGQCDGVSREDGTRYVAAEDDLHGPGHAADRHVLGHLGDTDLLVFAELARPRVLPELSRLLVVLALLAGALLQRRKPLALDGVEDLGLADLAVVGHYLDPRLHLRRPHDHAVELHERADAVRPEFSHLEGLASVARLEAHVEVVLQPQGEATGLRPRSALLLQHVLAPLHDHVLRQRAVGIEAPVPVRQLGVASLVEVLRKPQRVLLDVLDPVLDRLLQLNLRDACGQSDGIVRLHDLLLAEILEIVEVDEDGLDPLVDGLLQQRLVLPEAVLRVRLLRALLVRGDELAAERLQLGKSPHGLSRPHEVVLGRVLAHDVGRHRSRPRESRRRSAK